MPFPSLPACLQCELGEEDRPWYRALQGEQRAKFRSVLRQLHINVETLGGEGNCGKRGDGGVGRLGGQLAGQMQGTPHGAAVQRARQSSA
jgi:hypothetical protein